MPRPNARGGHHGPAAGGRAPFRNRIIAAEIALAAKHDIDPSPGLVRIADIEDDFSGKGLPGCNQQTRRRQPRISP